MMTCVRLPRARSSMPAAESETALRRLYTASAKAPAVLEVPRRSDLAVDGVGNPNKVPAFRQAMEALYVLAYAPRFLLTKRPEQAPDDPPAADPVAAGTSRGF